MLPTLTYPWALLLLLAIPALAWLYLRRSRGAVQFPDHRLLPRTAGRRVFLARWGGLALRLLTLTLLVIALCGPRWIDEKERIPTDGIAIAMVLDVSASMGEEDFAVENETTTRLLGVQKLFRLFVKGGTTSDGVELKGRPNDLIALVTFATHPDTACPLTLEHGTLLEIMDAQTPRTASEEGTTNPGDAIAWALHALQKAPTTRKVIVFLTDGEANVPGKLGPEEAARLAANVSIPIYAIDASSVPKNAAEEATAKGMRATMEKISGLSRGEYLRSQDGRALAQAYESIDRLERARILSFQYRRYREGFAWFALAALAVAVAVVLLEATIWRKVP